MNAIDSRCAKAKQFELLTQCAPGTLMGRLLRVDSEKWAKLVKERNIRFQ